MKIKDFKHQNIAIIGSTKYKEEILSLAKELEIGENTVLVSHVFSHSDGYELTEDEVKIMVENGHHRINIADLIIAVVDKCIGESTFEEIIYALTYGDKHHKESISTKVVYLYHIHEKDIIGVLYNENSSKDDIMSAIESTEEYPKLS